MAAAAVEAELAVVNIIGTMAVPAALTKRRLHGERLPVATLTRDVDVGAIEHKPRVPVMIELPLLPVHRVVALRALVSEATAMRVIVAVALDTECRRIVEHL